jgi:hypothetical protein
MPPTPDKNDTHDCAEGIRDRVTRRLQCLRERRGLSVYGLV